MDTELTASDLAQITAAERYLRVWRYLRWVQVATSLALILLAFTFIVQQPEQEFMFDILHPAILAGLGGAALGDALADRKAKNWRLVVKLGKACGQTPTSD